MKVFVRQRHCVMLFGLGLVGSSIADCLSTFHKFCGYYHPYTWGNENLAGRQRQALVARAKICDRLDVIWAAGRAGFAVASDDALREMEEFRHVLAFAERAHGDVSFHLVSSAGGLFAGKMHVDHTTPLEPLQEYGRLKLQQELHLAQSRVERKVVYRPSTVYGLSPKGRLGIVSLLLQNAIKHRVSTIYGHPYTIRDYVYVADIGEFIASRVVGRINHGLEANLLASGKPTEALEIVRHVERAIGRRIYMRFDTHPTNTSSMSFRTSALPSGWQPKDLRVGIAAVAAQTRAAFATGLI